MSSIDQHEAPQPVYPTQAEVPAGYPVKGGELEPQQQVQEETKSRGDGFWKGCCAALCCCCAIDICF